MMCPALLLLLRIALAVQGLSFFQMQIRTVCFSSSSMKNAIAVLMGVALNLENTFGRMAILVILILPIQEYGRYFHLLQLLSSSTSFFNVL